MIDLTIIQLERRIEKLIEEGCKQFCITELGFELTQDVLFKDESLHVFPAVEHQGAHKRNLQYDCDHQKKKAGRMGKGRSG